MPYLRTRLAAVAWVRLGGDRPLGHEAPEARVTDLYHSAPTTVRKPVRIESGATFCCSFGANGLAVTSVSRVFTLLKKARCRANTLLPMEYFIWISVLVVDECRKLFHMRREWDKGLGLLNPWSP